MPKVPNRLIFEFPTMSKDLCEESHGWGRKRNRDIPQVTVIIFFINGIIPFFLFLLFAVYCYLASSFFHF
jgi:hypothetical protein